MTDEDLETLEPAQEEEKPPGAEAEVVEGEEGTDYSFNLDDENVKVVGGDQPEEEPASEEPLEL